MERFEEALKGLDITDQRTKEKVAPLRQRFLVASQRLQRPLTPLNASVHAAASRAVTKRGSPSTSLYWVSVYDRVGLFDVDDCHVARLIDAALRSAALSSAKSMIAALGASSNPAALSCMIGVHPTADGKGSGSGSVLGYPVAFLRTKELTTWKSPGGGKAPAPAGTMANPFGTVAVDKKRSLWYPRVQLSAIKPSFDVPELAARRLKPKDVDDVVVVVNISVFTNKSIADVIAALLAICALEPSMPRIIAEALEGSYDARPARHLSRLCSIRLLRAAMQLLTLPVAVFVAVLVVALELAERARVGLLDILMMGTVYEMKTTLP
ncbi:hypothetical protein I4F81_004150 [Pyropia yezoensis]|uniref:Uncharacterized protein n=1 Tax=Pyropia yezoensis TaxID=2788 RepID=A0ACC3BVM3_PYRYE|nr:hypothetical protein I4F81_004150 [Neopyropia yezoensis]